MFFIKPVYAQCPVCVVTVGGGLFIAKKFGIDDLLVAIWISGLNTVIAFWMGKLIKKKILNNPLLWSLFLYISTLLYFYFSHQLGVKGNVFLGIDKVILGMTIGMLIVFLAVFIDKLIRYKNGGKVMVYYQKVIIPVVLLILVTIVLKRFL